MTHLRTLFVWAALALVALSFVAYLLGSPSWGGVLVVGIVIGATIAGNQTHPSPSTRGAADLPSSPRTPDSAAASDTTSDLEHETSQGSAEDDDFATDAKSVLGPAFVAKPGRDAAPTSVQPAGRSLLARIEASRGSAPASPPTKTLACTEHPECGPVTRVGHTGHGHGPSESTGLWCWHFDEWVLGRPDEEAAEGSDLAARRADQASRNGGDPFAHKTYPTGP